MASDLSVFSPMPSLSSSSSSGNDQKTMILHKRKDFIEKDDEAKNHPNRTYYYKKQNIDELVNRCDEELRRDPSNVKARYIRASSFMKKKRYSKAVGDFDQVLRYKPDDVASLYNRGVGTFALLLIYKLYIYLLTLISEQHWKS